MRPKFTFARRTKKSKPIHHALLAFDTENWPKTGAFRCGALYGRRKDTHGVEHEVNEYFTSKDELQSWLIKHRTVGDSKQKMPFKLIGFNLAYDMVYLTEIIDPETVFRVNSRFITAKLINGIELLDLQNHATQGALADWVNWCNMAEKGIKKIDIEDFDTVDDETLKAHVLADARATYELGSFLEDFYVYTCKVGLKLTIGSCALEIFRSQFFNDYWARDDDFLNRYEREAFRGGRNEMFMKGEQTVHSSDIHSNYLSIMRDCDMPDPISGQYIENGSVYQQYFKKYLGIYHCIVTAPKSKVMVLPVFTNKMIFPYGENEGFEGFWTNIELEEALKRGYEIKEVIDFIYYKKKSRVFREYALWVWDNRKRFKSENNRGMEQLMKLLGNSLFGKFGQQDGFGGYYGDETGFNGDILGKTTIPSVVNGVKYISVPGDKREDSGHTFPCIPVFITSYARVKLLKMLLKHEKTLVYCDTDSVKYLVDDVAEPDLNELGDWGHEYTKTETYYGLKWYGEKCKGIPKKHKILRDDENERVYEFEKPNRQVESQRRGLIPNKWEIHKKVCIKRDDKREWISNNESWPFNIDGHRIEHYDLTFSLPKSRSSRLRDLIIDVKNTLSDAGPSRISGLEEENEAPDSDIFDSWYEDNRLEHYTQRRKLALELNEINKKLGIRPIPGDGDKKQVQTILRKMAEKCFEEPEALQVIFEEVIQ